MAAGGLQGAYESFARGDHEPLRALLAPDFEWVGPEGRTRRGPDEALTALAEPDALDVREFVESDDRALVTGVMAVGGEELPFAHVWVLREGLALRAAAYGGHAPVATAATRRQLAEVADDLIEQTAEIRRQWNRLGDALRAAGLEEEADAAEEAAGGAASARLVAVDMAHEGSTREEVDAYLRDELGLQDTAAILNEVFGAEAAPEEAPVPNVEEPAGETPRLARLFARNRG